MSDQPLHAEVPNSGPPPMPSPDYSGAGAAYSAPYQSTGQGWYYPAGQTMPPGMPVGVRQKGFFAKLFDLSFSTFITPTIFKILFVLSIVVSVIAWLILTVVTFMASTGLGFAVLFLGWIGALLMIIIHRVFFEFVLAMIKTAEHTGRLAGMN